MCEDFGFRQQLRRLSLFCARVYCLGFMAVHVELIVGCTGGIQSRDNHNGNVRNGCWAALLEFFQIPLISRRALVTLSTVLRAQNESASMKVLSRSAT